MRSSFFGLDIAVRGLYTSQRSLYITSHNISNINTPGYSRQVGVQKATSPMALLDGTGMLGTGAEITAVQRIRDSYLDYKYWSENTSYGEWETKSYMMEDLEGIFEEISGNGATKFLNDFFSSLQELLKNPESLQAREVVRSNAISLTKYLNSTAERLQKLREDSNYAVKVVVDKINLLASEIKNLNQQIYRLELDGNAANDLRDQRMVLVDELSKLIDIEVNEVVTGKTADGHEDKKFQIIVNGTYLVNHFDSYAIEYYEVSDPESIKYGMYDLRWEKSGSPIEPKGGALKGYLDVRDGTAQGTEYKGIPYYINMLDEFARTFARAFNEGVFKDGEKHLDGHAGGVGLDGSTGIRFFSYDNKPSSEMSSLSSYENITAANITLSAELQGPDGIYKIAVSSANGESGNNDNIKQLIELRHNSKIFNAGAPEDFMKSLVSSLGIDTQHAQTMHTIQEKMVHQIENRRVSVSGVSIDEELADLVRFQHAYNAAARVITVMDEIYYVTINRMGTMGR
ncbi:MAG: flagellar hook-associated protein FlgK [Clostridiaceae bacterium]|nr:flagellar hook-associated protein FlgK [Clostridiaceae bacterium]